MEELIRVRVIGNLHVLTVPYQFVAAIADADAAQQYGFGKGTGKVEA